MFLASCSVIRNGEGQVVYHWQKNNTGIEKFAKDHQSCIDYSKKWKFIPDFRSWFYTEETKLKTRADWNSKYGIWATYVAYPGAQPLIVNSSSEDDDVYQYKYENCMRSKGYLYRNYDIPEITNINLYKKRSAIYNLFGYSL